MGIRFLANRACPPVRVSNTRKAELTAGFVFAIRSCSCPENLLPSRSGWGVFFVADSQMFPVQLSSCLSF